MSKHTNHNNQANQLNSNKGTLGFNKACIATMKNHGKQLNPNNTSLTPRQQFVQLYGSPRILATENTALQELLLLTRIQEDFPTTDPYILGFYVTRVLLIRELFPSLYIESKNFFKAIVQNKKSTSKWQEIKFKR